MCKQVFSYCLSKQYTRNWVIMYLKVEVCIKMKYYKYNYVFFYSTLNKFKDRISQIMKDTLSKFTLIGDIMNFFYNSLSSRPL